jgi:glycerophosphoryl diester phosphodiesterase
MQMWREALSRWKNVWRNILASQRQVFVAHFAYTGLGIVVLFPLLGLFGRLLLRFSGEPALSDQDILYFALTPFGAASFIVLAALLIFILAFEQAALMTIGMAAQRNKPITAFTALHHSLKQAPRIFAFAHRLVVRLLFISAPFLALAVAIALWLFASYDINFYISNKPPAFWTAALLIGAILLAFLLVVVRKLLDWSMALPLIVCTDIHPGQCFRQSTEISRSNSRPLLLALAIWATASFASGVVVVAVIQLIGTTLISLAINSLNWLVMLLGGLTATWLLANLVLTAWTSGAFAYFVVDFFVEARPGHYVADPDSARRNIKTGPYGYFTAKKIAAILIVATSVSVLAGLWLLNGIQVNDNVAVIAHRGAAGSAPENTIAAVRRAIEDRADWIEIDVQETADGEVVVVHDSDFMKLAGVNLNVWNGTLEQIKAIDVGLWFGPEFADARVPTLAEVLNEVRGRSRVIIELKYYGHDRNLEQRVIDIVEDADMTDEVMIMSLSYAGMRKLRVLRPEWTIGLLAAQGAGNLAQLDIDFLAVSVRIANSQFIRRAHAAGKPVYVWTVNDTVNMSRVMSLGVDGIISDEPALLREVLADRSELSSVERLLIHMADLLGLPSPARVYRDRSP